MGLFGSREKRLQRRAARKERRAERKENKAEKAAAKGNTVRAQKLRAAATELREEASANIFLGKLVIETKHYKPTPQEVQLVAGGYNLSGVQAQRLLSRLIEIDAMPAAAQQAQWNSDPRLHEPMGMNFTDRDIDKLLKRVKKFEDILRTAVFYVVLKEGTNYAGLNMGLLNRPLSKNFRMRLDLPNNIRNSSGSLNEAATRREIADTITHELVHLLGVAHPGDEDIRSALKNPDSYAKLSAGFA